MPSIFSVMLGPEIVLWLLGGLVVSFVAGFFAMSEGSVFKRTPGYLLLSLLFITAIGALIVIWVRSSFLPAFIAFILSWMALRIGGRLMMTVLRRNR